MGMSTLDMLQFHWWDYEDDNYIKALEYLDDLREEHIISHLALTNFDSEHLEKIISMGIPILSNQVQYSIIDRRPERKMAEVCKKHNVKLLTYGTLGGGLFTERYYQKPEPKRFELNTASLQKYKYMLDRWGDWALFQNLLNTLKEIADKYSVSIANVAVRYILEQDFVGGAIIGIRLGASEHIQENSQIFSFSLNEADIKMIDTVSKDSNNLFEIIGDCGDEYR
jgi:aryl-alcohol dehydrogenase-like predicted oxidoreductase